MIVKQKICVECKNKVYIWSKSLCKPCFFKLNPPKPINKISKKLKEKNVIKKEKTKVLHQFFLDLWDERADKNGCVRCFETDIYMSYTIYKENSICYSHQLPKSKYPEYALDKNNILIVLPNVHANWEASQESCPKMLEYTKKLKKKYNIM